MCGQGKDRYGIDSERIVINQQGGHVAPDTVSLRYFLVLAQELNFTRAAARIGIAQPALSARMRRLEAELGTALLVRNTRSVVLTTAGAALAESAPLMLTPGRRCENGKPVPVNDPEWVKYTNELAEAGKAAYKASQSRNQEAVSDISNVVADACLNCHQVYRDKRRAGVDPIDPSNKANRCVK